MRFFFLFVIFAIIAATTVAGDLTTTTFHEMRLQTPSDWTVEQVSDDQLAIRGNATYRSDVLIARFTSDKIGRLVSDEDLRASIKNLYISLGMDSSGTVTLKYLDNRHMVTFDTTFAILKIEGHNAFYIKIKGLFFNSPESGQVLFLMHYKDSGPFDSVTTADLDTIFKSARIVGPFADSLYPPDHSLNYLYVLLLLMLAAFFFMRNRRIQNSRNPLGRNSEHFWRCPECRLINHNENAQCRRCGAVRPESENIRR